jgi:hypothetical protein
MTGQHKFIHGTYIYQFCPPYGPAVAKSSGGWFSSRRGTEKAKAVAAERPLESPTSETAPRASKRRRVARSNEVIIDLDPHRVSDRAETATLRHDLLYNECVLSKSERWRALTLIWALCLHHLPPPQEERLQLRVYGESSRSLAADVPGRLLTVRASTLLPRLTSVARHHRRPGREPAQAVEREGLAIRPTHRRGARLSDLDHLVPLGLPRAASYPARAPAARLDRL